MSKCEISWGPSDQIASGHCCMGVGYKRAKIFERNSRTLWWANRHLWRTNPSLQSPWVRHLQNRVDWHHASWMYPFRNQHHRLCTPMRDQLMHQHQVQRGTMSLSHPQRVIQWPWPLQKIDASEILVVAPKRSSMKRGLPSSGERTPAKAEPHDDLETPMKKIKYPGFGGAASKQTQCKVCDVPRDGNFTGACCHFCLLGCRRICNHQRIPEAVQEQGETSNLGSLCPGLEKESDLKPSKCKCSCMQMAGLVKQMASMLPKLEVALRRLRRLKSLQGSA